MSITGFRPAGRDSELDGCLRQHFTPEFLGRLDHVIRFEPLEQEAMETIAWKYLRQLQERSATVGTQLQIPEELASHLARQCRGKGGARQLRRMVQTEVEGPLAAVLLRCARKPGKLRVILEDGAVSFCS